MAENAEPTLFIDGRSASHSRTTGWERYAQELVKRLNHQPNVEVFEGPVGSAVNRLVDDTIRVPAAARSHQVAHFPTFPPLRFPPKTETIYTLFDLTWWRYPETASTLGKHYYRRLAERAVPRSTVLTISETTADEIREHFRLPANRVVATPLGSALPVDVAPTVRDRPYLLSVASVEPRKNLDRLIAAYRNSAISRTHDLLLVGRQAWGSLPSGVTLMTGLTDLELAALYAGASATVLVSLYEGFGLPILESLAAGTPVICSDIAVFREVAGSDATFVNPLDSAAIAEALTAAPTLPKLDPARIEFFRGQTWDKTVESICQVYRGFGVPIDLGR